MNWLLYIGGGILSLFWSSYLFSTFWHGGKMKDKSNIPLTMWFLNFLSWELCWIWICWKFV